MSSTVQRITPFLWYENQAEEAAGFYVSIFDDSRITSVLRYGDEAARASGQPAGTVMTVAFELQGQGFVALNGGPVFKFTEAVSFVVNCESQEEVDYYWESLASGGDEKSQQCGWLKDRYGVSWQVVPRELIGLLGDPGKSGKAMAALLQMKKIDMNLLKSNL